MSGERSENPASAYAAASGRRTYLEPQVELIAFHVAQEQVAQAER
jgi:hypothetical protein